MHRLKLAVALAAGAAFAASAAAHEVKSPRDAATGQSSGKVSMQDMHFSSRAEASAKCPGGVTLDRPDGSFACDVATADHAINEKGTAGTKGTTKDPK